MRRIYSGGNKHNAAGSAGKGSSKPNVKKVEFPVQKATNNLKTKMRVWKYHQSKGGVKV